MQNENAKFQPQQLYKIFKVQTSLGESRDNFRTLHQSESWLDQHMFEGLGKPRKTADGKEVVGLVEIRHECVDLDVWAKFKFSPVEGLAGVQKVTKYICGKIPNPFEPNNPKVALPKAIAV